MKYRANASDTWHKIKVKALDSMPIGSVVEYVGQASDIPQGWEAISGGKIQKTSNVAPTMASIVNTKNNSTTDGYSCGFINELVKDVYSTNETKTNKVWIDGKPVYRKVIETNFTNELEITRTLSSLGLQDIEAVIELNSFLQGNPIEQDYYANDSDKLRTLINPRGLIVLIGATYPARPCTVYTIIEYTKTTDTATRTINTDFTKKGNGDDEETKKEESR